MSWWTNIFKPKQAQCACHAPAKNLSEASTGRSLQIKCLSGEEGACQRMREMGFCESSVVEKISDSGALICKVCDSKVVISKDLAKNIIVEDICQLKDHARPKGSSQTVLLSKMKLGQRGVIRDFAIDCDDCERMGEMGLTPGEPVEIVRYAPLGDPIEIKVRGYNLSLRKQEADLVRIDLLQ